MFLECSLIGKELHLHTYYANTHLFKSEPNIWSIEQQRKARARWPLDSSAPFLKGPGLKL